MNEIERNFRLARARKCTEIALSSINDAEIKSLYPGMAIDILHASLSINKLLKKIDQDLEAAIETARKQT